MKFYYAAVSFLQNDSEIRCPRFFPFVKIERSTILSYCTRFYKTIPKFDVRAFFLRKKRALYYSFVLHAFLQNDSEIRCPRFFSFVKKERSTILSYYTHFYKTIPKFDVRDFFSFVKKERSTILSYYMHFYKTLPKFDVRDFFPS